VGGVPPEINGGRVEDVLDVGAELIFALSAGRDRKQQEHGEEEGVSVGQFHRNFKEKAGGTGLAHIKRVRQRAKECQLGEGTVACHKERVIAPRLAVKLLRTSTPRVA